ncbi:hypothetical protein V7S43_010755 [Phytophthora oleae]|uniref:Uncharacterized protein n=1 Tax=Phytophthora oleae TaxID=2107226 RepID=A0ABD3FFY2_9STRA
MTTNASWELIKENSGVLKKNNFKGILDFGAPQEAQLLLAQENTTVIEPGDQKAHAWPHEREELSKHLHRCPYPIYHVDEFGKCRHRRFPADVHPVGDLGN